VSPRAIWVLAAAGAVLDRKPARDDARFFDEWVAPILTRNCLGCHNHELNDGDISFEDRATLLKDRKGAVPALVPGIPEESALVRAIRRDGDVQMPPGKRLSSRDIAILTEWIKRGAASGTKLRLRAPGAVIN
jgi:Planctomycete cytochrome C